MDLKTILQTKFRIFAAMSNSVKMLKLVLDLLSLNRTAVKIMGVEYEVSHFLQCDINCVTRARS